MISTTTYKHILIFFIVFSFTFTNCTQKPNKIVPYKDMDLALIEQTEKIYFEFFKSCEQDSLAQFLNYAFIKEDNRKVLFSGYGFDICSFIDSRLGEITSIDLIEAIYFDDLEKYMRCKLKALKINKAIEFRMVLNFENNLLQLGFYEWNDKYNKKTQEKILNN